MFECEVALFGQDISDYPMSLGISFLTLFPIVLFLNNTYDMPSISVRLFSTSVYGKRHGKILMLGAFRKNRCPPLLLHTRHELHYFTR